MSVFTGQPQEPERKPWHPAPVDLVPGVNCPFGTTIIPTPVLQGGMPMGVSIEPWYAPCNTLCALFDSEKMICSLRSSPVAALNAAKGLLNRAHQHLPEGDTENV